MNKMILVLGGIRSGKSWFAEQKALYYSEKPVYIATSIPFDDDMKARVNIHRERRGNAFELIEEPHDIRIPLKTLKNRTVLIDCLTINLSNRMLANENDLNLAQLMKDDDAYLEEIKQIIVENDLKVIFVSNEVGLAPVEINKLGRYFQDLQGRWNRQIAAFSHEVHFLQAGIPRLLKKEPVKPFKISAPSYLLPTGYIENVTYLMDKVDDIQLLLFDTTTDDPIFKDETIHTLNYLAKDAPLTFSVHMPSKPTIHDGWQPIAQKAEFIIDKLQALPISSYTFHYDLPPRRKWQNLTQTEKQRMDNEYIELFTHLTHRFPDADLSLENTWTPLSALDRVVSTSDVSYCIDIGHLSIQEWPLDEIPQRLPRTSVIHLHGIEPQSGIPRDHRAITHNPQIFQFLETFTGVLTIENYHKSLFQKSSDVLTAYF